MVQLRTFGGIDLRDASGAPLHDLLRQPKRVALLLYLALGEPAGLHRRDTLLALFWPELDTARARAALRKSLYVLRAALGPDVVVTRGDEEVGLDPAAVWCDARAFLEAADAARHLDALELYRGEWLAGFHVTDAAAKLGEWLDETRTALRQQAAASAWAAAAELEREGDAAAATALGQRAVRLAPGDEPGLRRLMALLDRGGDRAGALQAYDEFAAWLRREYDTTPAPETEAAAAEIRERTAATTGGAGQRTGGAAAGGGVAGPAPRARWFSSPVFVSAFVTLVAAAALYALVGGGRSPIDRREGGVAVLEFANLSATPANDFLARGLADETAARLARVAGFRVASATAARRFRAGVDDPATIGYALGVAWLVSGSVQPGAARLRVSVELIRAQDGALVWSGGFETAEDDVLAIEDSIAQAVAQAIAPRLRRDEVARLATDPTANPQAFLHYLRGTYLLSQRNPTAVARAIGELEAAAALDTTFAEALTQAGFGYALYIDWEWSYEGVSRDSLFALAEHSAERALARDSLSPGAWWLRGFLGMHRDGGTFGGARGAFERAVTLDPRHAAALHSYGVMEARLGNDSAARVLLDRALVAEPGRPITLFVLSELAYRARAFPEAQQWLDSALVVEPGFFFAYVFRALARLHLGDTTGARHDAATAVRYSGGDPVPGTAALVVLEARVGDSSAAGALRARLDRDVALRGEAARTTAILWLAMADVAVGRRDAAIRRLERVTERTAEFWFWLQLPEFDGVRGDPRFVRLAAAARPRRSEPPGVAGLDRPPAAAQRGGP